MDINFEIKNLKKKELPKRSEEEINILVESLMSKMTLVEKVGQLSQTFYYSEVITGPAFFTPSRKTQSAPKSFTK